MNSYKKDAPIFDIDDPNTCEQHLANIEWAMADARLKDTLPGLVLYIKDQLRRAWDLMPAWCRYCGNTTKCTAWRVEEDCFLCHECFNK